MSKPFLLFKGPVATRSGYGDHARDLLESLFELDKYEIKIVPTRWGNTPQNQLNPTTDVGKKIIENCLENKVNNAILERQENKWFQ